MAKNYYNWVMARKKKDTYINKVVNKCYLCAVYSKCIKGTDKIRRINNGYLGRIIREDGFILVNGKLKNDSEPLKSVFSIRSFSRLY